MTNKFAAECKALLRKEGAVYRNGQWRLDSNGQETPLGKSSIEAVTRLSELGELFELAGLDQKDRGALLGALLGVAKVEDRECWDQWKLAGDLLLAERAKR